MLIVSVCVCVWVCLLLLDRWLWFSPTNRSMWSLWLRTLYVCVRLGLDWVNVCARVRKPHFADFFRTYSFFGFVFFFFSFSQKCDAKPFSLAHAFLARCVPFSSHCAPRNLHPINRQLTHSISKHYRCMQNKRMRYKFASIWLNLTICARKLILTSVFFCCLDLKFDFSLFQPVGRCIVCITISIKIKDHRCRSLLCIYMPLWRLLLQLLMMMIYAIVMRFESIFDSFFFCFFTLATLHKFHCHRWSSHIFSSDFGYHV